MFEELYDAVSKLFSWRWPTAEGVITAVHVLSAYYSGEDVSRLRIVVEYKFSIGEDGPYSGETTWNPWSGSAQVMDINDRIHAGQAVTIHYRPDDPSVNRLDRSFWRELD